MNLKNKTITSLEDCYSELENNPDITLQTKYLFKYKNKSIYTTLGRIWFNLLLPDNYPEFVDRPLNKSDIEKITYKIYELNPADVAADCLSKLQKETFKLSTISPTTFSKDSFVVPKSIKKEKENKITDKTKIEDFSSITNQIATDFLNNSNDTGLKDLINSKTSSKLNTQALASWIVAKGPVMDVENKISKPIKHSLTDGYTPEEYYIAAAEARRGYYIRAVGTSDPGTLARHVVFALSNIKLTNKDCGTKKYIDLMVTNKIFKYLQGRYFINERTNKLERITEDSTHIINTMIKLRSPIYCKDKNGICPICYGKTHDEIGTNKIGLIDGSIINAVGVQGYAMKARHAATSVSLKKCDFLKDMIEI